MCASTASCRPRCSRRCASSRAIRSSMRASSHRFPACTSSARPRGSPSGRSSGSSPGPNSELARSPRGSLGARWSRPRSPPPIASWTTERRNDDGDRRSNAPSRTRRARPRQRLQSARHRPEPRAAWDPGVGPPGRARARGLFPLLRADPLVARGRRGGARPLPPRALRAQRDRRLDDLPDRRRNGGASGPQPARARREVPAHRAALGRAAVGLRQAPNVPARRRARHRPPAYALPADRGRPSRLGRSVSGDPQAGDPDGAQSLHDVEGLASRGSRRARGALRGGLGAGRPVAHHGPGADRGRRGVPALVRRALPRRPTGVDFPYLLWRMTTGASVPEVRGRSGVRWVRALTDLPTAFGEIRAGRLSVAAYLSSLRGPIEFAILATDDPVPALIELPAALYLAWRRASAGRDLPESLATAVPSGQGASR